MFTANRRPVISNGAAAAPHRAASVSGPISGASTRPPERGRQFGPVGSGQCDSRHGGRRRAPRHRSGGERAGEWRLDPGKIGIMVFSAGGYVAVQAALDHTADSRPAFVAYIYGRCENAAEIKIGTAPVAQHP